jgi:hypothetical protein
MGFHTAIISPEVSPFPGPLEQFTMKPVRVVPTIGDDRRAHRPRWIELSSTSQCVDAAQAADQWVGK